MTHTRSDTSSQSLTLLLLQVGFLISPVLVEHSGQYWCRAEYGGRSSEYGVSLNVLLQTRSDISQLEHRQYGYSGNNRL